MRGYYSGYGATALIIGYIILLATSIGNIFNFFANFGAIVGYLFIAVGYSQLHPCISKLKMPELKYLRTTYTPPTDPYQVYAPPYYQPPHQQSYSYQPQQASSVRSTETVRKGFKFCSYCGKKIESDSKFCPYCGKKIG